MCNELDLAFEKTINVDDILAEKSVKMFLKSKLFQDQFFFCRSSVHSRNIFSSQELFVLSRYWNSDRVGLAGLVARS